MPHIIIDGYNLIRQIPALAARERVSLQNGRDDLVALLARYKRVKAHSITVVFDGVSDMSEFAPAQKQAGINLRYSPTGVTADEIIKQLARAEKNQAVVVSSDRSVMDAAERSGCATLTAQEFYDRLLVAAFLDTTGFEKDETDSSPRRAHKRWTTKKKGSSHKRSKKERKKFVAVKKI